MLNLGTFAAVLIRLGFETGFLIGWLFSFGTFVGVMTAPQKFGLTQESPEKES